MPLARDYKHFPAAPASQPTRRLRSSTAKSASAEPTTTRATCSLYGWRATSEDASASTTLRAGGFRHLIALTDRQREPVKQRAALLCDYVRRRVRTPPLATNGVSRKIADLRVRYRNPARQARKTIAEIGTRVQPHAMETPKTVAKIARGLD